MGVWVIIGVIALASIILGVSLHQAFWTLVGTIVAVIVVCWVLTGAWDWLGEIGDKNLKKKKKQEEAKVPKLIVFLMAVLGLIIAAFFFN